MSNSTMWWAFAGALCGLAGHLELIRRFGTVLPYRDSWQLTGVELLGPWLDGTLDSYSFFQPLNDHWPVLTRLLSFGLVQLNGQWNNLVETTVNAGILAGAIGVFLVTVLPGLKRGSALLVAVLVGGIMALPITWENTLWGIQSLPYLQILLSLLYFRGVVTTRDIGGRWVATQVAGACLLLTQHSAILAQVAVMPLLAWQWWRGESDRRSVLASLVVAVVTVLAFAVVAPAMETTAHLRADSLAVGIEITLRQLAWPTGHPGWAFLLWAPWLALAFDRLGRRRASPALAFLLVAGLWVGGQAAAIGYGRGVGAVTHISRYGDFMALGFLINAASLLMLMQVWSRRSVQVGLAALGGLVLLVTWSGFKWETTGSHTEFNLSRRLAENEANIRRVSDYILTRDPAVLSLENGGATLFTYPPSVQALLDREYFRALLPPEAGAQESRMDHGRLGWLPALVLARPMGFLGLAFVFFGIGWWCSRTRQENNTHQAQSVEVSEWTPRGVMRGALAVALLSTGLLVLAWPHPLVFNEVQRLRQAFVPEGAPVTVIDGLEWSLVSDHDAEVAKMPAAVLSYPVAWRKIAMGTAHDGSTETRGVFATTSFPIEADILAILFTGYPCTSGSGMRWRLDPPNGGEAKWIGYLGPDPANDWACWSENVSAYQNWQASLYLFDGLDGPRGWLGVMPPVMTADATWSDDWLRRLRIEQMGKGHRVLAAVAGATWLVILIGGVGRMRALRRRT